MSNSINLGHELRLIVCVCLLIVVEWIVPRANLEGQAIVRGIGRILSVWQELRGTA